MPSPKPISLEQEAAASYAGPEPKPYVLVGELPAGSVTPGVAVANATDATDVITQLNALLASLRSAGLIKSA